MLGDLIKTCKTCRGSGRVKSAIWRLYYINVARYDFGDLEGFDPCEKPTFPKHVECPKCHGTGKRLTDSGRYFIEYMGDSLKKDIS